MNGRDRRRLDNAAALLRCRGCAGTGSVSARAVPPTAREVIAADLAGLAERGTEYALTVPPAARNADEWADALRTDGATPRGSELLAAVLATPGMLTADVVARLREYAEDHQ